MWSVNFCNTICLKNTKSCEQVILFKVQRFLIKSHSQFHTLDFTSLNILIYQFKDVLLQQNLHGNPLSKFLTFKKTKELKQINTFVWVVYGVLHSSSLVAMVWVPEDEEGTRVRNHPGGTGGPGWAESTGAGSDQSNQGSGGEVGGQRASCSIMHSPKKGLITYCTIHSAVHLKLREKNLADELIEIARKPAIAPLGMKKGLNDI